MRIAIVTPPPGGVGSVGKARGVHRKGSVRGAGRVGGNQITSLRWARILRRLGHRISIFRSDLGRHRATTTVESISPSPRTTAPRASILRPQHSAARVAASHSLPRAASRRAAFPAEFDLLIALHARKSHDAIAAFHREHPDRPIVVAMTGTDLYGDLSKGRRGASASRRALRSIALADRIVVLNPAGPSSLPRSARPRTRVVLQSVALPAGLRSGRRGLGRPGPRRASRSREGAVASSLIAGRAARGPASGRRSEPPPVSHRPKPPFDVCVIGNLRPVKDPFRAALASRLLPPSSAIRILHLGSPLDTRMEARALAEEARNPRYRWLGALGHAAALRRLARCRLLVLPSRMEGGANVIMEALALDVPVLCSRIPGSLGLLGDDYPGTFTTGGTAALARLLLRAETDERFYDLLRRRCARKKALTNPEREVRAWRSLLRELRSRRGDRLNLSSTRSRSGLRRSG